MSINIRVNHVRKSKVFHGGDKISGTVVATGPIKEDATIVHVKFKGKSETRIKQSAGQHKSTYTDKVKFFSVVRILFRGACNIEVGASISWDFSFQLPLLAEPTLDIVYSKTWNSPYAQAAHLLPPSISVSGRKRLRAYKASISYELHAELQRNGFLSSNLRKAGALPVTQYRAIAEVDSDPQMKTLRQDFRHATSRLLPDHESRARSLREWASDTFTSKAPSVWFSLSARSPKTMIEGQSIPIEICLAVDSARSTVPSLPEFKLISAHYEFKEHTHVRAKTSLIHSDVTVEPSNVLLSRYLPLGTTALEIDQVIDIGVLKKVALPNVELTPSFDSYSLYRRYAAYLAVRMTCAGKEFAADFKWKPVTILPAEVETPGDDDEDAMGALGKAEASSVGVLEFGDAALEVGVGILELVSNVFGNMS